MLDIRNETEIRFFGVKRSGNHGVIVWIAHLWADPIYFINNVRHFEDPFDTPHDWRKTANTVDLRKGKIGKERFSTEIRLRKKECLLLGYEDLDLTRLQNRLLLPEDAIGDSRVRFNCVLLRDHYNWLASRIKNYENEASPYGYNRVKKDLELWKQYAREYLGETAYLNDAKKVTISYNEWFLSDAYRRSLASALSRQFTDRGLEIVPVIGRGSSFDKREFNNQAQRMKVLERWKSMASNEVFSAICRDPEAMELTRRALGFAI